MEPPNERLTSLAKSLGFDLVAFTSPVLDERYTTRFHDWVASGAHGDMHYLKRRIDDAVDVEKLLPGTRSVVVLGVCYHHPVISTNVAGGRISRYAVYRDYHRIIGKRLREIETFIRGELDGEARGFVDTGPIQERSYAESAGLGYLGRSGMLIAPGLGSWVFLACVLTTLEIELVKGAALCPAMAVGAASTRVQQMRSEATELWMLADASAT